MVPWRPSRNRLRLYLRIAAFGTLSTLIWLVYGRTIVTSDSVHTQWDANGYWHGPRRVESSSLWSYVPTTADGEDSVEEPVEVPLTWEWSNTMRRKGYRRPSWGALREVGPKASFRTNLKPNMKYLVASPINGWNNQIIEAVNVVNAFFAHHGHLGARGEHPLSFTEVFDVSGLIKAWNGRPLVDAAELKVDDKVAPRHRTVVYDGEHRQRGADGRRLVSGDLIAAEEPEPDYMDCWSTNMVLGKLDFYHDNVHEPVTRSYAPLPINVNPDKRWDRFSIPLTAEAIRNYSVPGARLPESTVARLHELGEVTGISPDDQYTCLDRTYWMVDAPHNEDLHHQWRNGVGAWAAVGRHLKFQPGIHQIADDFLRDLMGLSWDAEIPPYMAVHIRRGDFYPALKAITQRQWAHRAFLLLTRYREERQVDIKHIIWTSDETDEEWLKEMRLPGWYHVDHMKTQTGNRLGFWWPTLIDSCILSSSAAFMGVSSSTMSILPSRRVLDAGGMVELFWHSQYKVPEDWAWEI